MRSLTARCSRCKRRIVGPVQVAAHLVGDFLRGVTQIATSAAYRDAHRVVFDHEPELELVGPEVPRVAGSEARP